MKNSQINIKKRNGKLEPLQLDKIHKVIEWAAEGLDVSVSEVELRSHIQFFDGMTTSQIHETMIKAAADLISEQEPDYQYLASRLAIFHLRKKAYKDFTPPHLKNHLERMISIGKYDDSIQGKYSDDELEEINSTIDHWRDMNFSYAAVKQLEGKYLVQNRVSGEIYESPQFIYAAIPMYLYQNFPKEQRMENIKEFYQATSLFKLSLPTPIMAGVRTPSRQFASCVLIENGDSLNSINATSSAIIKYVSQKAGIGVNVGQIRALGSEIRGGDAYHTGIIPFIKHFQTAVKSCSQGGVRGGAATLFYPIWHLEVESLIVLKNNRGVDENRARHLDYGIQISKLFYQRLQKNADITLFSPSDVPGLYDSFFANQTEFEELYLKYEEMAAQKDENGKPLIRSKKINATELFTNIAIERSQTGRLYIQNVDHCNTHSPFNPELAPVHQSNLCLEVLLPTKPLNSVDDPEGEIALCTLSAFNLGEIENLEELEKLSLIIVSALDALLDYQEYLLPAAEKNKKRRTLGVGVINLAYYFAKNGVKYSDGSANKLTHETFEAIQYYLLKASNKLAEEKGACEYFGDTTYAQGLLPIDTYNKNVDKIYPNELKLDWESLRADIKKYGLRNSTLTALMPSETSSQISNATNGIEPPRGAVSVKTSKDGILKQVIPEIKTLKQNYEFLWTIESNKGYIDLVALMQKFVDQSVSANTNYDPSKYEEEKLPIKLVLRDLLYAYQQGLKTLYYHNTRDGAGDGQEDDGCESGACKI